ncbi:peptidoglycan recognition protein family protein [Streptomyces camelliae]|uniref:Peptidoglycan recognition family protein n=1 Tax=Streptomyces camelliae TaxID=3004093 RepID=A0ABY7PBC7_9ACTN|nr:peptidoglycan recognition family protein [Streptomyces sp. HUAS 2-6]WBO67913.1 peptidoglycan recognition family protein [Streptomyces sp. HUAS 2-6]
MPLCPFASVRLLAGPKPPSPLQPTQIIVHTANTTLAAADIRFRRPDARGWSHFGVSATGKITQWLDTSTPADSAYRANLRSDGTGAVSITTEGNVSEPWTDAQLDALIRLHWWLMRAHPAIAHRACRTAADPGLAHHTLLGSPSPWTPIPKSCPGPRRIQQWEDSLLPRVLAPYGISVSDMRPRHEHAEEIVRELLSVSVASPSTPTAEETPLTSSSDQLSAMPSQPPSPAADPVPRPRAQDSATSVPARQHHPVREALLDFFLPDSAPHGPKPSPPPAEG